MAKIILTFMMMSVTAYGGVDASEVGGSDNPTYNLYQQLRKLEPDRILEAGGKTLQRDVHTFSFDSGAFYFLEAIEGRTVGAVFMGEGRYILSPASETERKQLRMSSLGKYDENLSEPFNALLMMFTDDTFEELSGGGEVVSGGSPEASKRLAKFRKTLKEDFFLNLELRLVQSLVNGGEASKRHAFAALIDSPKLPDALAGYDQMGVGKLLLSTGRLDPDQSVLYVNHDSKGGYWYMSPSVADISSGAWRKQRTIPYVDALHYDIDTYISGREQITATTRVRFKNLTPGLRALPVFLASVYELQSVRLVGEGMPKVAMVSHVDKSVFFAEPLEADKEYTLEISYSGKKVLQEYTQGLFSVRARTTWYANLGVFSDKATFRLSFDTPKANRIVSVGELIEDRKEKGRRHTVWECKVPLNVAGFNFGDFKIKTQDEAGMEISVYYDDSTPENILHNIMADTVNSYRLFSAYFGKLPYERIAVTRQAEISFGQAWPTLVFLPAISFMNGTAVAQYSRELSTFFHEEITPHELAHQWWGHQVTAASYRDQWLEEGIAEFSAGLLIEATKGKKTDFWSSRGEGLLEKSLYGKMRNYEAGPVSQGFRLNNRNARSAYSYIAYNKGALVIHMLRMMMQDKSQNPDARFQAMMRDFIDQYRDQPASTHDFQTMVEKYMTPQMKQLGQGSMNWFFDQWVYGDLVPSYKTDIKISKTSDGKYHLKGTVTQSGVPEDFRMPVPLYADFGKGRMVKFGALPLIGNATQDLDVVIPIPKKPKKIVLNGHYDILAHYK